MDPTDVLKVLWQQRRYVLPALLLALAAAAYVYQLAPRSYETTATYALVNPAVPTTEELERDPALAGLNGDNPYLRSADTNLITDAVIARLSAASTVETLQAAGVGTDYGVGPGVGGNGFVVDITGVGPTPEAAIATTAAVGTVLESELRELQQVNGADDRYLFVPLQLAGPDDATEQFSSRLRAVIVVLLGGGVLVFAAASLGRFQDRARARRAAARAATTADAVPDAPPPAPAPETPAPPAPPAPAPPPAPGPAAAGARTRSRTPAASRSRTAGPRARPAPRSAPGPDAGAPESAAPESAAPGAADPDPAEPAPDPEAVPARSGGLPTAKRRG